MIQGTIRSSLGVHTDQKLSALREEKSTIEQLLDKEQKTLSAIANLEAHPGWQLIKRSIQETIDSYKSGRVLDKLAGNPTISNDEYGQQARVAALVAKELERHLKLVNDATTAMADMKAEARHAKARRR